MTLAPVPPGYVIRDVTDPLALRELEDVQATAWGYSDRELLPRTMFRISGALGGVVLAAYPEGGGPAVGLVYGFPALQGGQLWHHSHQLALRPEVRGAGLAVALKLAQRERVLAQGLTRMTWTFDPLVTRNARLNFGKLGVTVSEYLPDWYGPGADRLLADWDLTRPHAERPAPCPEGQYVLQASDEQPSPPVLNADAPRLLVQVPLQPDPAWRLPVREVLAHYLGRGYRLTDLARAGERAFYVLERQG
ncbi:acyl-CoA acyltransferase [Deinococcus sp. VB343]|uniref:acyl-CoA acyltransferase n=1 Tax=Deinococcus sp. VB343 TaxID=3385567 RepID=UPI0039C9E54D